MRIAGNQLFLLWLRHKHNTQHPVVVLRAGLQLLADDLGGWGGICHDVVQQLRDQYPSQPMLYFSLRNQMQQQGQGQQAAANGGSGGSFGASSPAHTR